METNVFSCTVTFAGAGIDVDEPCHLKIHIQDLQPAEQRMPAPGCRERK